MFFYAMQKLTETAFKRRLDALKSALVNGEDFDSALDAFYARLLATRQETLILRADQYLRMFLPPDGQTRLNRPGLVQALYSCGFIPQASALDKPDADAPLRPYTPLRTLSKYAGAADKASYSARLKRLAKLPALFSAAAVRDFKELADNYARGNYKSVIILAGSLLELLLIARFKKMRILQIKNVLPDKHPAKKLLEAGLNDLLHLAEEENLLPREGLRLTKAARICRNLVHPGLEISSRQKVNANKAEICFLSVLEALDALFPPSNKL